MIETIIINIIIGIYYENNLSNVCSIFINKFNGKIINIQIYLLNFFFQKKQNNRQMNNFDLLGIDDDDANNNKRVRRIGQ